MQGEHITSTNRDVKRILYVLGFVFIVFFAFFLLVPPSARADCAVISDGGGCGGSGPQCDPFYMVSVCCANGFHPESGTVLYDHTCASNAGGTITCPYQNSLCVANPYSQAAYYSQAYYQGVYYAEATYYAQAYYQGAYYVQGAYYSQAYYQGAYYTQAAYYAQAYYQGAYYVQGAYYSQGVYYSQAYYQGVYYTQALYYSQGYYQGVYYTQAAYYSQAAYYTQATYYAQATYYSQAYYQAAYPPTITSVSAACSPSTVSPGKTSQCTATVTGTFAFSSAVTWSVNGVNGGNVGVGTITASGLYTPPAFLPVPVTFTIKATSNQDVSKSGTAVITVNVPASCIPATQTVNVGQIASFTGSGGDTINYAWAAPGAIPASGAAKNFSTNYAAAGPKVVTVTSGGVSASCNVTVILISCSFSANPPKVIAPGSTAVSWSCVGATTCNLTSNKGDSYPNVVLPKGSLSMSPSSTRTYTLSCNNGAAVYQTSLNLTVVPPGLMEF